MIDAWGISCELAFRWMSLDLTDDKSTLVQVMAWCRQATSHYLRQCWPRSLSPCGVTRPQWVKSLPTINYFNVYDKILVSYWWWKYLQEPHIDGLVQEKRNSKISFKSSWANVKLTGGETGMFPESGDALTGFRGGDSTLELRDLARGTGTGEAKK